MLLKAFAKINWSLDITGVRDDGYHLMDMVMQPVSLADDITLTAAPDLSIFTDGYPPSRADSSNLAWRAAELLRNTYSVNTGVHIALHKRIPVGAGLGGGSADAAAVLYGLNRLWDLRIPQDSLESLSLSLGADVPFCLRGGLVRTGGIGEILEDHSFRASYWLLIIQPCKALSTRQIFSAWTSSDDLRHPRTDDVLKALEEGNPSLLSSLIGNVLKALEEGNPSLLSSSIGNVLEPVSSAACPEIPQAVTALHSAGAFAAQMTGSGSAVFGAFRSGALAEKAYHVLSGKYRTIHLCHTQSDSIRIVEE